MGETPGGNDMQKKRYSGELKAKVALEALKGQRTANEIAGEYGVHPNQVCKWKKEAHQGLAQIFSKQREQVSGAEEKLKDQLYSQIGQLKVELDWLKKKTGIIF